MTYRIRLTPPELRKHAADIEQNAATVQREVSEIVNLLNQLKPSFIGETSTAFYRDFSKAQQDMDKWDDIVRSFAIEIKAAADKLEAADKAHK
jgi:WXG100 family type VII secretion target